MTRAGTRTGCVYRHLLNRRSFRAAMVDVLSANTGVDRCGPGAPMITQGYSNDASASNGSFHPSYGQSSHHATPTMPAIVSETK